MIQAQIKQIHLFGKGASLGSQMPPLGPKCDDFEDMDREQLPIPPGIMLSPDLIDHLRKEPAIFDVLIDALEQHTGRRLGDSESPLFLAIRSHHPDFQASLHFGVDLNTRSLLEIQTQDLRFVSWAIYSATCSYAQRTLGIAPAALSDLLEDIKLEYSVWRAESLPAEAWVALASRVQHLAVNEHECVWPQEPRERLLQVILGAAPSAPLILQQMVYGKGPKSGLGVLYTRSPSTGERGCVGEFLANACLEDLQQGRLLPAPLGAEEGEPESLEGLFPDAHECLITQARRLEAHRKDMLRVSFVVEGGQVWFLRSCSGKCNARAAIKIAVDLSEEGCISRDTALLRCAPKNVEEMLHPSLSPGIQRDLMARGLAASPGVTSGNLAFDLGDVFRRVGMGQKVIFARVDIIPEDLEGIQASAGILTSGGGLTSHAAVIARGLGKVCVVGCQELRIDAVSKTLSVGSHTLHSGDLITLDGGTGEVILGSVEHLTHRPPAELTKLLNWADARRTLKVYANLNRAEEVSLALSLGADGVGLCRTEQMLFQGGALASLQALLLSRSPELQRKAIEVIEEIQRRETLALFAALGDHPVTLRLLDIPSRSLFPSSTDLNVLAEALRLQLKELRARIEALHEFNPALGFRGARMGSMRPELYRLQVRAIFHAAIDHQLENDSAPQFSLMLPMIASSEEARWHRELIDESAEGVFASRGARVSYRVGVMIELPRACLVAAKIAREVDFFSIGTNDLTQMTFGISRDDTTRFLPHYLRSGFIEGDPFCTLDVDGVGALVRVAVDGGRGEKADFPIGVCGEHGGDPKSISFFHVLGLDHISCSPYRVPVARLAAARAALESIPSLILTSQA